MSQLNDKKSVEAKSNMLYCDDKEGDRERERGKEREKEGGTSSSSYRNYNGDTVRNTVSTGRLNYNNVLMQLRKLCNHPYLLLEDIKTIPDELYYEHLVASSGKLSLLHGLLNNLIPKGHKVSHMMLYCNHRSSFLHYFLFIYFTYTSVQLLVSF